MEEKVIYSRPDLHNGLYEHALETGGWFVLITLVLQERRLVVAELRLTPALENWPYDTYPAWDPAAADAQVPTGGLTTSTLGQLRLGRLVEQARQAARTALPALAARGEEAAAVWTLELARERRAVGRKGHSEEHYAQVARDFVQLLHTPGRGVIPQLAKQWLHSEETVRGWVQRARRLGLLTPARPGRTEGELTDRAIEILKTLKEKQNG